MNHIYGKGFAQLRKGSNEWRRSIFLNLMFLFLLLAIANGFNTDEAKKADLTGQPQGLNGRTHDFIPTHDLELQTQELELTANEKIQNRHEETQAIVEQYTKIETIVDRFRSDLAITADVCILIVPKNDRLVSVQRGVKRPEGFILSFDQSFLDSLDESELSAAVAHELGHVWIFTHHPYLQTELLANRIALKLVSRESLGKVYEKVWQDKGATRDLVALFEE